MFCPTHDNSSCSGSYCLARRVNQNPIDGTLTPFHWAHRNHGGVCVGNSVSISKVIASFTSIVAQLLFGFPVHEAWCSVTGFCLFLFCFVLFCCVCVCVSVRARARAFCVCTSVHASVRMCVRVFVCYTNSVTLNIYKLHNFCHFKHLYATQILPF